MVEIYRNLPLRFNLQIFSTFKIWLRTWDCYNITFIVRSGSSQSILTRSLPRLGRTGSGDDRIPGETNFSSQLGCRDQIYWAELYLELIQGALFRQFARWWESHSSSTKLLISSNNFIQRHLIGNLNTKPTSNLSLLSVKDSGGWKLFFSPSTVNITSDEIGWRLRGWKLLNISNSRGELYKALHNF